MNTSRITTSNNDRVKNANLPKIYSAGERKASAKGALRAKNADDEDEESPPELTSEEDEGEDFPPGDDDQLEYLENVIDRLAVQCDYGRPVAEVLETLEQILGTKVRGRKLPPSVRTYCLALGITSTKYPMMQTAKRTLLVLSKRLFAEESRNQGRGWTEVKPDIIECLQEALRYKKYQFPRRPERVSDWEVWLGRVAADIGRELTSFTELQAEIMRSPELYPVRWDAVQFNQQPKEVLNQLWKTMEEYIRLAPRERKPEPTQSKNNNKSKSSRSTLVCTKCKRKGHSQETCYAKTRDAQDKDRQKGSSAGKVQQVKEKEPTW
ncbi:uncharacterized protein NEMAJ01_1171 [Nematocida major]|uniref:uncharacterized protein n=1 Tax=Nematocida major TaxID=1912982 RepID=UPI002007E3D6|nr:uncharacterized protein NEMAJ01_1171 [Nematocida major]KAH9386275.1 hypothetical protein NEMAJ01_1171 [Nematocida major]